MKLRTRKLAVLVAPLDWGLGHATRCIPLIRHLSQQGHEVVIAAEGGASELLRANFPSLPQVTLPGYGVKYSKSKQWFAFKILLQVPGIAGAIRRENTWLKRLLENRHFDIVISDNRYGLHHPDLHSVILTHQLQIITGFGSKVDALLRSLHYRVLGKFDSVWIVDKKAKDNLAGTLSSPRSVPSNSRYIGWLSQFGSPERVPSESTEKHILILLSGPEPMRSALEAKLLAQIIPMTDRRFTVVAGRPSSSARNSFPAHIEYHPYLAGDLLRSRLNSSELVICRSGYSTLMDLAALGKKALLIPTPGQTEQEYLAELLLNRWVCFSKDQDTVDLTRDIPEALKFPGFKTPGDEDFHEAVYAAVKEIVSSVRIPASPRV